jgi:hypothetical protein
MGLQFLNVNMMKIGFFNEIILRVGFKLIFQSELNQLQSNFKIKVIHGFCWKFPFKNLQLQL